MKIIRLSMLVFTLLSTTGCLPKLSSTDLARLRPERPVELDRLNMFLGEWETTGEIKLAVSDEIIHTKGRNKAHWSMDGRMLLDHAELDMGPMGPMTGMSIWTYDEGSGKFRMWWFDSFGETSEAVAKWNERRRSWMLKATGRKYGYTTSGHGSVRVIDDNTVEWTWVEQDGMGVITFANMKGISRRIGPGDAKPIPSLQP